jgi:hypothetical protein
LETIRRRPWPRGVSALAATVALAACGGVGGDGADRAGEEVPVRSAAVDLRIGALEGAGAEVFGRIGGIAVDESGRLFVLDNHASEVRVFDESGRHEFSFARPGSGPGELASACCIAFDREGRLWVRDNGNGRYVAFAVDGRAAAPVATVRMRHGDVNRWAPTTFDEEGRVIDIGLRADPATGRAVPTRIHTGPDDGEGFELPLPSAPEGAIPMHTVEVRIGESIGRRFFYPPYGPQHLFAHGPGGRFAEAISSAYRVRWYAADGTVLRTIEGSDARGPALTPEQRVRADSALSADEQRFGTSMPFGVPERAQPLADLHFDEAGRLWVQLTVQPGEPRQAHVYDDAGRHVETVEWPAGVDLFAGSTVRSDMLVGVTRDDLDVPYVTRLRLR